VPSDHGLVTTEIDGQLATITLDRPDARNALSESLVADLSAAVDAVEDADVRAVVVRGAGDTFCAGGDLTQTPEAFLDEVRATNDVLVRMRRSRLPYVAAVDGAAIGGGFELALACDLRVIGREARLALPEVTLGIFPCAGGTRLLAKEIGAAPARELVLTGEPIDAAEAAELGLATRLVDPGRVDDAAAALATDVADNSPVAVAAAKRSLADAFDRSLADGLEWDVELARRVVHAADFDEGTSAFLEGRDPEFPGR
jgi:enoyl-CoA hydratase/carnithine racemase